MFSERVGDDDDDDMDVDIHNNENNNENNKTHNEIGDVSGNVNSSSAPAPSSASASSASSALVTSLGGVLMVRTEAATVGGSPRRPRSRTHSNSTLGSQPGSHAASPNTSPRYMPLRTDAKEDSAASNNNLSLGAKLVRLFHNPNSAASASGSAAANGSAAAGVNPSFRETKQHASFVQVVPAPSASATASSSSSSSSYKGIGVGLGVGNSVRGGGGGGLSLNNNNSSTRSPDGNNRSGNTVGGGSTFFLSNNGVTSRTGRFGGGGGGGGGGGVHSGIIIEPGSSLPPSTSARSLRSAVWAKREMEDDFSTVDWSRDRERHLHNQAAPVEGSSIRAVVMRAAHASEGWLICLVVGLATGVLAALINTAVHWMVDFKMGYCRDSFWLSYSFCCSEKEVADIIADHCEKWVLWGEAFGSSASAFWTSYLFYILIGCGAAVTSAWLVIAFAPYAAGSGIPEVKTILGGVVIKRFLGMWTLLIKSVGLSLSVGSGLSLGKEGPYVHIASCFGNIFSRFFPKYRDNHAKKNEVISAAAAAGVSVAFGAPVGGVLFSLEEVSTYFPHKTMWRSFFCAIVAAITLHYIDPLQTGKLVLFQIDYNVTWSWFEMVPFTLLGVLGGIIGVFFIRMNTKVTRFRRSHPWLKRHPIVEVLCVCFVTVLIKYNTDFLRGSDNTTLSLLFGQCDQLNDPFDICNLDTAGTAMLNLFMTAVIVQFLTIFTFGISVPAGLFIPSLLTGAALGRMVGTLMRVMQHNHPGSPLFDNCEQVSDCITPGVYAIIGAAAVLGGVTRMTISLVVIMFELTGGLEYILPIMVAIMFSKWVGDAFGRQSIYDEYIHLNQYPFMENVEDIPLTVKAEDVMTKELIVLTMHGHDIDSLYQYVQAAVNLKINGFPVVTSPSDMLVVGYITRQELESGLEQALQDPCVTKETKCYFAMLDMRYPRNAPHVDFHSFLHSTPIQIAESTPLHRIYNIFKNLGLRYCLVTRFGKLVGLITKKDVLNFFADQHFAG